MKETRVDIVDATTGETVAYCNGPTQTGSCPYADKDGNMPCNGRRIFPMDAGPELCLIFVPPQSRHCPQAWNLDSIGY